MAVSVFGCPTVVQVRVNVVWDVMAGDAKVLEQEPEETGMVFEYPGAVTVQLFTSVAETRSDTVPFAATRSGLAESVQVGAWTVTGGK